MSERTAIITGGSRGIGAAIAIKFASMGINVAIVYAGNHEAAHRVVADCVDRYQVKAESYQADVSSFEESKEVVKKIKAEFGKISILVNNAGITRDGLLVMMKEADFDAVLDTNLKGAYHMIRHCAGDMIRSRKGCIINISSVSGLMGNAGQCNYAASKAGLIGLTKSVAKELAQRGVRCNAIAPGFVETDMTQDLADNPMLAHIPLGCMGKAEDVALAAAYLVDAGYVTGDVLRVDGGIAM